MPKIKATAPAKINLTFDILGLLDDGYHRVETLLQAIDLCDSLVLDVDDAARDTTVTITTESLPASAADFPLGDDNLISKAVRLYCKTTGFSAQVNVKLSKSIPMGAGLAGGSADAAATLAGLNRSFGNALTERELTNLGAVLGADVPFCIHGGTAFGTNRGDVLAACESGIDFSLCIAKPANINVSTPWAYKQFDEFASHHDGGMRRPDSHGAINAIARGDTERALACFGNVFEPVIFQAHPSLVEIKDMLLKQGAWYVQLSGSGPALFALVADIEHAHFVRRKVLDLNLEFHICSSTKCGVQIEELA